MLVALIAVSCITVLTLALLAHLTTRPSPAERRERLLERDNLRLSRDLEVAHDRIMFLVGRDWTVPPAEAERAIRDLPPHEEDEPDLLHHDDLDDYLNGGRDDDDDGLILLPEPAASSM